MNNLDARVNANDKMATEIWSIKQNVENFIWQVSNETIIVELWIHVYFNFNML